MAQAFAAFALARPSPLALERARAALEQALAQPFAGAPMGARRRFAIGSAAVVAPLLTVSAVAAATGQEELARPITIVTAAVSSGMSVVASFEGLPPLVQAPPSPTAAPQATAATPPSARALAVADAASESGPAAAATQAQSLPPAAATPAATAPATAEAAGAGGTAASARPPCPAPGGHGQAECATPSPTPGAASATSAQEAETPDERLQAYLDKLKRKPGEESAGHAAASPSATSTPTP